MRIIGIAMLVAGFLWTAFDTCFYFTAASYTRWMWQSKQLPAGETVLRSEAVSGMRDMQMALKEKHQILIFPAMLMLAGGIIGSLALKEKKDRRDSAS